MSQNKMSRQRKTSTGIPTSSRSSFQGASAIKGRASATPLMRPSVSSRTSSSAVKGSARASYIGTTEHHISKDPRPLSDKSYIKRSILELVNILNELGFPKSIYPKMLNPPTNKDYQQIFEFFIKSTFGHFKMLGKPEEEMLRVVKDLGYPFNISKSTLSNVGTMSAWPQALGVLSWIAHQVKYNVALNEGVNLSLDDDPRKELKLDFFYKSYEEFMKGTDGPYPHLNQQVQRKLEVLDANAESAIKELQSINMHLSEDFQRKLKDKEAKDHLADELTTQKSNTQKMQDYIVQVDKYIEKVKEKSTETKNLVLERRQNIEEEKVAITKTKTQISLQPMTAVAAERLKVELQQLEESLKSETELLEDITKELWDREMQYEQLVSKMDEIVRKHNDEMQKFHEDLPHVCESLSVEELRTPGDEKDCYLQTGHQGVEVNNERLIAKILPYLTTMNNKLVEVQGSLDRELNNYSKRVLQDKEVLEDLEKSRETLQKQLEKVTSEIEFLQKETSKEEQSNKLEIENKQKQLEQLQVISLESAEDLENQHKSIKLEIKQSQKSFEERESSYTECLQKMERRNQEFRDKVQEMVQKLDDTFKQSEESFKQNIEARLSQINALHERANPLIKQLQSDSENLPTPDTLPSVG